jgi:hypothetical protein
MAEVQLSAYAMARFPSGDDRFAAGRKGGWDR